MVVDVIVITVILLSSITIPSWIYPFLFYLQVNSMYICLITISRNISGHSIYCRIFSSDFQCYSTICKYIYICHNFVCFILINAALLHQQCSQSLFPLWFLFIPWNVSTCFLQFQIYSIFADTSYFLSYLYFL